MIAYLMYLSLALFALGVSGVASSRHFLIMLLSIEIIIVAATLLAAAIYSNVMAGGIMELLFALWTVAAVEVMVLIVFYRYLAKYELSMDVTRLSRLRDG